MRKEYKNYYFWINVVDSSKKQMQFAQKIYENMQIIDRTAISSEELSTKIWYKQMPTPATTHVQRNK